MHQHACHGKNKTIHSSLQIDHFKNIVDYLYIKVGGAQHIITLDEHEIRMSIRGTLSYMTLSPCTNKEWGTIPHVLLTSDKVWHPTFLDCEGKLENEEWFDAQPFFPDGTDSKLLNEHGEYINTSD